MQIFLPNLNFFKNNEELKMTESSDQPPSPTSAPELRPCPFCGSGDIRQHSDHYGENFTSRIFCNNCYAQGPSGRISADDKALAIRKWNTRIVRGNKRLV